MKKPLLLAPAIVLLALVAACGPRRMAPFSPHRANTDVHRAAHANQTCVGCHEVSRLPGGHQPAEDCLKCHRILPGE